MVIRDLTMMDAISFSSFQLIRLLYDEYVYYLVEHKVASATGETPIAVLGKLDKDAIVRNNTNIIVDGLAKKSATASMSSPVIKPNLKQSSEMNIHSL